MSITPPFLVAAGLVSAGMAQQAPPRAGSDAAIRTEAARHPSAVGTATDRRHAGSKASKSKPTPTPTPTGEAASGRTEPTGTVPVGAPGTTDPTIPGSPPQR